eukprot:TRINITY_DN7618_c0_g1_i1.p1 TRINITY_DN7618_c0_g1~~TRINITY_DN7618_c0_g1_i1.p1  ORF type:complete len:466 (+),score=121.22 TRINITY_DN7618_c0_g1_i1:129-1400(+)
MKDHCFRCFGGKNSSTKTGQEIKLLRCSRCSFLQYCSRECQRKDWDDYHKRECEFLCGIKPHRPTQSVQLMSRLLLAFERDSKLLSLAKSIKVHRDQHPEEKVIRYGQMATLVMDFIKKDQKLSQAQWLSPSLLIDLFCICGCNNANIADPEMNYIGGGLYKEIARLNHSCEPNCVVVVEGNVAKIRSIRRIENDEELTISYVEIANSKLIRNQKLLENFFFQCQCNRCIDNPENNKLERTIESPLCLKCSSGGKPHFIPRNGDSFQCSKCGSSYPFASIRSTTERRLEEGRKRKEGGDLNASWKDLSLLKLEIVKDFSKFNQDLLATNTELLDVALKMEKWEEAEKICEEIVTTYRKVYQSNWPLLGLQLFMLGKLQWSRGKGTEAFKSLREAYEKLTISHGKSCILFVELDQTMREINFPQ